MDTKKIYERLLDILHEENIKLDEPMKKHTSFRVGGVADILVKPRNEEEIIDVINLLKKENIPYLVMGNGSNMLVKDGGIRGVVIKISDSFNHFEINENQIVANSGAMLSIIGKAVLKSDLKGFEFASGIPGTLGGAITMNAGAYGGEMKDIIESVRVIDENGEILELENEEMKFSYRNSIVKEKNYIVLSAKINLQKGDYDEIKSTMDEMTKKRVNNQPLNLPSGGSTFKRPEGYIAAKLIQDANLKGLTLRGAQVSEKHSGFIVNTGEATAKDIINLIDIVKNIVKLKFNVELEEEIKIVGED